MQLLNICTNAIALFAALYITVGLAAHLAYCWQQSIAHEAKSLAFHNSTPAEVDLPAPSLLLPAAEVHPWEAVADRLLSVEPILAVVPLAALPEFAEAVALETPELAEVAPTDVATAPAPDLTFFTIRQLKQMASERKLPRYSSMTKPQLVAALG